MSLLYPEKVWMAFEDQFITDLTAEHEKDIHSVSQPARIMSSIDFTEARFLSSWTRRKDYSAFIALNNED